MSREVDLVPQLLKSPSRNRPQRGLQAGDTDGPCIALPRDGQTPTGRRVPAARRLRVSAQMELERGKGKETSDDIFYFICLHFT